jgi:hypothetical protein
LNYYNGSSWSAVVGGGADSSAPSFSVSKNSAQSLAAGWTKVNWNIKNFDTNSNFASDRYTPTVAGKYLLTANVRNANGSGVVTATGIYKNGAVLHYSVSSGDGAPSAAISAVVDANGTTDYFEIYQYSNVSSSVYVTDATANNFSGTLISPVTVSSGGSGTAGYIPQWTSSSILGNSPLAVSGTNVGIGTSSPSALLHLASDAATQLRVDGFVSNSAASALILGKSRGTQASPTAILSGDDVGAFISRSLGTTGTGTGGSGAMVVGVAAENHTATAQGQDLVFKTNPTGSLIATERLRIVANGNVGIGTTSPGQALTVAGTIESTSGGVKYPDASTQATSAFGPSFCAKITTTASSANGTSIKVPFDTVEFDTDTNYSTTNRRFTPTKAGYYRVSTFITITQAPSTALTNVMGLFKNGVAHKTVQRLINYAASYSDTMNLETLIYLNGSTDYIEVFFSSNATASASLVTGAGSSFCAEWIRP